MRHFGLPLGLLLAGGSAFAQSPVVAVCEAHPDRMTVMNLGTNVLLFDFIDQPAATVTHAILGTSYTAIPLGFTKFHIPAEVAAHPLSFRIHEFDCLGLRCAGEATDLIPAEKSFRSILVRDDGEALRKTVLDAAWDGQNQVSWTVLQNDLSDELLVLHLTDGQAARSVTVSGECVDDPDSQDVVVGAPPLVMPTAGILDPYLQPPSVYPVPPVWTDVQTFGISF